MSYEFGSLLIKWINITLKLIY